MQHEILYLSQENVAAARLLGISPQLLNYKMKKYQINYKKYKS